MGGSLEKLSVLVLRKMLSDVHVESRSAVKMLDIVLSVQFELVYDREGVILRIVEVRTVHVVLRRDIEAVFHVPLVVLAGKVFARDELGVEHALGCLVLPVASVDGLKDRIHELIVLRVRADGETEEFSGVGQTVHAYGQILPVHRDETC